MTAATDKMLRMTYLLVGSSYRFSELRLNPMRLEKNPDNREGFLHGTSSVGGQLYTQILGVVVTFLFALVDSLILLSLVDQLIGLRVDDD